MTYSISARCSRTGEYGVGIATYSPNVGVRCPVVVAGREVDALLRHALAIDPSLHDLDLAAVQLEHRVVDIDEGLSRLRGDLGGVVGAGLAGEEVGLQVGLRDVATDADRVGGDALGFGQTEMITLGGNI